MFKIDNKGVQEKIDTYLGYKGLYESDQLDLVQLCDLLGLGVFNFDFEDDAKSGAISNSNGTWKIFVKETDSPKRKRFTIAHEIGHYISYVSDSHSKKLLDEKNGLIVDAALFRDPTAANNDAELEANEIAGQLLMPKEIVERLYTQGMNPEEMAEHFNVSEAAMFVRLRNLGFATLEDPWLMTTK